MKLKTLALALSLASCTVQAATTITLTESPTTGPQFRTSSGSFLLDGKLVRIGTFADKLTGLAVTPLANATFDTLALTFREFSTTQTGHASATNTGRINKTNIAGTVGTTGLAGADDPDSFFVGKAIYIWVYNSLTADSTAEQGIFGSSTVTDTFKDQATAFSMSLTRMNQAFGAFTPGTASATTASASGGFLTLAAPVPEPSAMLFLLVGLSAVGIRRRR